MMQPTINALSAAIAASTSGMTERAAPTVAITGVVCLFLL